MEIETAEKTSLVVANGKGGVGKTTITAALAGMYAAAGHRVLTVDLDPQASLGHDLGYRAEERDDEGRSLRTALLDGVKLVPAVRDVPPRLDAAPGGLALADVHGVAFARSSAGRSMTQALAASLAATTPDYDLVLIDTPPGGKPSVSVQVLPGGATTSKLSSGSI